MQRLPSWLRKLDAALEGLPEPADPMMLSQLDGYLAGVMVCPDLIMPSEWLPLVWGKDDDGNIAEPIFEDETQLRTTVDLVMRLYNTIGRDLTRGGDRYAPIYDAHPETGEVIWVFWLIGFKQAMSLRPDSWMDLAEGDDDEAATALSILITLIEIDNDEGSLPDKEVEELLAEAPDMIPYCIQCLNDHRMRRNPAAMPSAPKVGRNDPCPCGSGKKYKKCCGLN